MRRADPRAVAVLTGVDLREGLKQWRRAAEAQAKAPPAPAQTAQPRGRRGASTARPADSRAEAADAAAALSEDDRRLFRKTVGAVQPLPAKQRNRRPAGVQVDPAAREHQRQRRERAQGAQRAQPAAPAAAATPLSDGYAAVRSEGDDRQYLAPGHGDDVLRKLRQGHWPVEASLDLHGATQEQARERLDRYLQACLEHGLRCARVVHGKGLGSAAAEGPVLKPLVRRWLTQVPALIAYVECPPAEGGDGALRLLLRAPSPDGAPR